MLRRSLNWGDFDEAAFRARFARSPIKRIGRARFLRNVLIAIGNSHDAALAPVAAERLDDEEPLVRGAAVWALARLLVREEFVLLGQARAGTERNDPTADEWHSALGYTIL